MGVLYRPLCASVHVYPPRLLSVLLSVLLSRSRPTLLVDALQSTAGYGRQALSFESWASLMLSDPLQQRDCPWVAQFAQRADHLIEVDVLPSSLITGSRRGLLDRR